MGHQWLTDGDQKLTDGGPRVDRWGPRVDRWGPGLEVINLEFILRLKIKHIDWLLRTHVRKQPIIALYFESQTVLKFYNLEARS